MICSECDSEVAHKPGCTTGDRQKGRMMKRQAGRPRKYQVGNVVNFFRGDRRQYGTVVDYVEGVKTNNYVVMRTDMQGRNPSLPTIQLDTYKDKMQLTGRNSKQPPVVYRDIQRGQHVCDCPLCPENRWK